MSPLRYCAKCGSTDVHPSRLRTQFEALMLPFLFRPYRCWYCNRRFYGFVLAIRSPKTRPARLTDGLFGRRGVEDVLGLVSTSSDSSAGMSANFRQSDGWDLLVPRPSGSTVAAGNCDPLLSPRPPSSVFIDLREDPKAWAQMENELPEEVRSPSDCHAMAQGRTSLWWRWFLTWSLRVIHTDTILENIYFLYQKRHEHRAKPKYPYLSTPGSLSSGSTSRQ